MEKNKIFNVVAIILIVLGLSFIIYKHYNEEQPKTEYELEQEIDKVHKKEVMDYEVNKYYKILEEYRKTNP